MSSSSQWMSVDEAMQIASSAGATTSIVCAVEEYQDRFRVSLTTTDPDPTLSLGDESSRSLREMLLSVRQQVGPETWDYVARRTHPASRYRLRLTRGEQVIDVPFISARYAMMVAHGFADAHADAPAMVVANSLYGAVAMLGECA